MRTLGRTTLRSAAQVFRFHELLCFLDAYPDDARVRVLARRLLEGFGERRDLRRFRAALAGSGIAGTDTPYRFYWPTARWIAACWPAALVLDRSDPDHARAILDALPRLLVPAQAANLGDRSAPSLAVLDRLRPPGMTDAEYFIELVAAMPGDDRARETFFDRVDPPFILRSGPGTPERTTGHLDWLRPHYRETPLQAGRPDLRREARRPPRRVLAIGRGRAEALIRLARVSMITRERDLEAFQYANRDDALLVDDGAGLSFALVGMLPQRRSLLPAIYGGLILQNGVPVGYVQLDVLGRHAELSFNTFATFRGAESSRVFARLVAAVHRVFECDSFSIEPYQLGAGNDEGIETGAWWFYHRLGFRPRAAAARRIAAREMRRFAHAPGHRSSRRTLHALAQAHLFYSLVPARSAALPRTRAVLAATTRERRRFPRTTAAESHAAVAAALQILGAGPAYRPSAAAKAMLERWAGLALALTRNGGWHARERRALLRLIEAKAGREERTYLRLLLAHRRLRRLLDC